MSKVDLEVYIFFRGQCEEAMNFYKNIFGGKVEGSRYSDMPPGTPEMPGVEKNWFMHSTLEGGDIKLMASDSAKASPEAKKVSLSLGGTDEVKMRKIFDGLAEGGKVFQPLEKMFWGDIFGSLTDKFGVEWMMNVGSEKT
jgi:PhnB protein